MILDHCHNRALVECHVGLFEPVFRLIVTIVESADPPKLGPQIAVEVFQRGHGFLGSVWKATEGGVNVERAIVIPWDGASPIGLDSADRPQALAPYPLNRRETEWVGAHLRVVNRRV